MKPTEHEATVAVDAAARSIYAATAEMEARATGSEHRKALPEFDDLPALDQNKYREAVLPIVWAALEALPDRAHAAIVQAADVCCTCHTGDGKHEDWCVAVGILQMMEDETHD